MGGAFEDGKGNGSAAGGEGGGGHAPDGFTLRARVGPHLRGGVQFQSHQMTGDFVIRDLPGEDFLAGVASFRFADPGGEVGFVGGIVFGQFVAYGGEARFDAESFVVFGGKGGEAGAG